MSNHMTPVHPLPAPCCLHVLCGMSYPVSMTVSVLLDKEELETSYEKAASVE